MDKFIGQHDIIEDLRVHIAAANRVNRALEHTLFCGPAGYGKSTLARYIAQQMGGNLIEIAGARIKNSSNLDYIIFRLNKRDVLFIDEIHNLPTTQSEELYGLMETGEYYAIKIPSFTLIGATNYAGDINKPLRERFTHKYTFSEYDESQIKQILIDNGADATIAEAIAVRSRNIPRIAKQFLAKFKNEETLNVDRCLAMFKRLGVDDGGLTKEDVSVLSYLKNSGAVDPRSAVGERAICSALGIEGSDYKNIIEPFLLKKGLLNRTPRGRVISRNGIKYLQNELDK